ncbi:ROK family transcriptional regulator [Bifidobacterium aemilianum]|uniref:ROK family transcriptional regulator n=1 Tax=Bifidobacterium aemilianum TaxID=2493120 RepID=UPI0013750CF5|nr:ROK family protein [Bifidobacterium aemilianum]
MVSKALPAEARTYSRSAVLRLLYLSREMTRADLARATGLTRVAISEIIQQLIDDGFVLELGLDQSTRPGKRGRLLRLDENSRSIVVLDLSQPYVFRGTVMNLQGHVQVRAERDISQDGSVSLDLLADLTQELVAAAAAPILGLGISSPGIVTPEGVVSNSTYLGWKDVDLRSYMGGLVDCPVLVSNDANAEAVAEGRFGGDTSDLVLVQMTRGVGLGIVLGGQLVSGWSMAACEIGHVVIDQEGELCACGKRGCLETIISVPRLRARIEDNPDRKDDILVESGRLLGRVLSLPSAMLDLPEMVILGDPQVVNTVFMQAMEDEININTSVEFGDGIRVRRSLLGEDSNLLGVCALVLDKCLILAGLAARPSGSRLE